MSKFVGKVVIITGSSSGIGTGIALKFSNAGAHVVVHGLEKDKVADVANQCQLCSPTGLRPLEVVCDIAQPDQCQRIIDMTIEAFGRLDILINNAGIGMLSTIEDKDILDKYDKVMDINLKAIIYLSHLSVEHLIKTRGNIINISSVASRKICAVDMLTKCLSLELASKQIRVNSVNPASVKTNIAIAMGLPKEYIDRAFDEGGRKLPLQRCGTPEDTANAVLFLASDHLCSFITGCNMFVDGGDQLGSVN
ncbi:3-oxoacyl-[acyl-carrier-protein] reductase FabG-like [Oppia nitens]|uniref:3-oxoacyl-[acyl-carrier-protein] reductase FabG-like n=1 Tax=Oppia nitens TaxID=1686743 RepID=UPI0023DC7345|nr:3-oxoacyl-[acyl-carrier-protein] reductase FabG-like [Oppia nitens]